MTSNSRFKRMVDIKCFCGSEIMWDKKSGYGMCSDEECGSGFDSRITPEIRNYSNEKEMVFEK